MTQTIPSFEAAYRTHSGMLFRVFAKLASQGFVAQPPDAADIVHDFFVEEWPDIRRHFNPEKGASFATYLYTAFVRFARARIQRMHRQRGLLLAPQELLHLQDSMAAAPSPEDSVDISQADAALASLEPHQRKLIEKWLTRYPYSERELARELGVSRYKLRQQLVEALGRVSLHFATQASKDDVDHLVAEAMWQDKLTAEEAAATLGVTVQQVRNAHARNHQRIVRSLVPTPAQPARTRDVVMSEESLKALLGQIFSNAPIERVESDVTQQAPELVQYLDSEAAVAEQWQSLPADRLARLYEAIAKGMGEPGLPETEPNEEDPLFIAHANDRRAVGRAFAEALLPALPDGLWKLLRACQTYLPRAPRHVAEQLRREPDVIVGGNAALTLAEFGLTPSHIVVAADAVAMLIERAVDAEHFPQGQKLQFVRVAANDRRIAPLVHSLAEESSGRSISRDDLAPEISAVATVDTVVGEVLLDWLVDAAPFTKCLFSGFTAQSARANVLLQPLANVNQADTNLYTRWSSPWPALSQKYAAAASVAYYSGI